MAFALKRLTLFPKRYRRIIVVIPYLSIIEQNASVYSKLFGEGVVLEHHSGAYEKLKVDRAGVRAVFKPDPDPEDPTKGGYHRPATENWQAPVVVTTSVRFFESLLSNHPSDLRRVHNIARSIVILDEVQLLPRHLLAPLLTMIRELSADWGCSFVFSTATSPHSSAKPRWKHRLEQRKMDDGSPGRCGRSSRLPGSCTRDCGGRPWTGGLNQRELEQSG